ncbi:MAG: Ig-like domain-containing protein [Candidatus Fimimorpha sp.]
MKKIRVIAAVCCVVMGMHSIVSLAALNAIHFVDKKIILMENETMDLELMYDPQNTNDAIQWKTSDDTVVCVDNSGKITAKSVGKATITAIVDGKQDTCDVTVEKNQVSQQDIKLSKEILEIEEGKTAKITVIYESENMTDQEKVIWTSSDESIAKVSSDGTVTAMAQGRVIITAQADNQKKTCEVIVKEKVIVLKSISFEKDEYKLKKGQQIRLEVNYNPENTTTEKKAQWGSSNEAVATVSNGVVRAVGIGETVITATVDGKEAICDIVVQKRPVSGVKLEYETYDSENGWLDSVGEGETAGTDAFRVEAVRIRLNENKIGGGIRYSAYVQNVGWQSYVANGVMAGTVENNQRLEAIKIYLTGSVASKYDIYYRSHVEEEGWLSWAKNGEESGSEGLDKELQAIQIILLEKGSKGPDNY